MSGNLGTEALDFLVTEDDVQLVTEDYLPSTAAVTIVVSSIRRATGAAGSRQGTVGKTSRQANPVVVGRRPKVLCE